MTAVFIFATIVQITQTYRTAIAAVLLMVYAFIATPVQVWHHHTDVSSKENIVSVDKADSNCVVCSHKYSSFNEVTIVLFETVVAATKVIYSCYGPKLAKAPALLLSNKGPPVV